jgi:hypothetical protein
MKTQRICEILSRGLVTSKSVMEGIIGLAESPAAAELHAKNGCNAARDAIFSIPTLPLARKCGK